MHHDIGILKMGVAGLVWQSSKLPITLCAFSTQVFHVPNNHVLVYWQ
jgi:hypothetical protein